MGASVVRTKKRTMFFGYDNSTIWLIMVKPRLTICLNHGKTTMVFYHGSTIRPTMVNHDFTMVNHGFTMVNDMVTIPKNMVITMVLFWYGWPTPDTSLYPPQSHKSPSLGVTPFIQISGLARYFQKVFRHTVGEEIMTLALFVLTQYQSVTDGRTDRRTDVGVYRKLVVLQVFCFSTLTSGVRAK